jgi:hypothetical protein
LSDGVEADACINRSSQAAFVLGMRFLALRHIYLGGVPCDNAAIATELLGGGRVNVATRHYA